MQLLTLPPHILVLVFTYLAILLLLTLLCAAFRPHSIDAIIRLLEELYRLLYHENKRRTHSMYTKKKRKEG